jgi:hypothetical protein
MFGESV